MPNAPVIAALRQMCSTARSCSWKNNDELELALGEAVAFEKLRELEAAEIYVSITDASVQRAYNESRDGTVAAGGVVVFRVPRELERLVVVDNLAGLLAVPGAFIAEPNAYILVESGSDNEPFSHLRNEAINAAPVGVQRYHKAIKLWSVLAGQAEHVESSDGALLFFGIRRTEIRPGFRLEDLPEENAVDEIESFITDGDRRITRAEIFASALSEYLRDHNSGTAFRALLRDTRRFARRLKEGLAIYLAEHSPEKLAAEAKIASLSLSEKLEKIIGGLEAKSLAIPAALLLAVKDVSPGAGITSINAIILSAALSFGVTMTLVHNSQSSLLSVIKETIETSVAEFLNKGLDAKNPVISRTYQSLRTRCAAAFRGSVAMLVGSWVPLICVATTIFWGSPKSSPPTPAAPVTATPPANLTKEPPDSLPSIQFSLPKSETNEPDTNGRIKTENHQP